MGQATKIISITLDEKLDNFLDGNEISAGGYTKTGVKTAHKIHYEESLEPCIVKCKIAATSETDLPAIKAYKGTLTYERDSGGTVTVPNAFCVGDPAEKGGEIELEFWGDPADA